MALAFWAREFKGPPIPARPGCLEGRPHMMTQSSTKGSAVSDGDLMFIPASELAGMVRAGELSARELVQVSLERIEELQPRAERVRAGRRRARAGRCRAGANGRRAPVRGRADRDQEQPAGERPAAHLRVFADEGLRRRLRPQRHPPARACRLHRGRAPRRCPSTESCRPARRACSGRRATPGTWSARRAARRAAPRPPWRPGWCRSRTATTAAVRSGSPRPAAAWSGSSPSAGASRPPLSSGSRCWGSTAC